MTEPLPAEPRARNRILVVLTAAMLTLASCGGGGGSDDSSDARTAETTVTEATDVEDGDGDGEDAPAGVVETAEAVSILPIGGEAPQGYRLGEASCAAEDDPDSETTERNTWIVYGVPEGWDPQGFTGGGSGGPHDSEEITFDTDGGNSSDGRVSVDVEWDSRSPDGTVLDANGDPFESFDYDYSVGSDEHRVTYDRVATVQIGDGEADLFHLDPTQNTDMLGTDVEYKARVEAYEVPRNGELDQTTRYSFVVTVGFDGDDVELSQADVEEILGSFAMPQCTWDRILADAELMLGVDLDGDGHVRNADDAQAELQETLEGVRDGLPPEAQEQYDDMMEKMNQD